jgi:hypothetical protein
MACWYYGTPCAKRTHAFEKEGKVWESKTFKTRESLQKWIDRNSHKYQWHELFVQNGYGVEFKKLRLVY